MNQNLQGINAMMGSFKNFGYPIKEIKKSLEQISKQKETSMIEPNKQYETMDGSDARVYATDGGGDTPIHGAVKTSNGWIASVWDKEGNNPTLSDYDLIEKWEPSFNEYCWFSNDEKSNTLFLGMFMNRTISGDYIAHPGTTYKYCYQFECELPEPIRGSIEVVSAPELDEHKEVIVTYIDQKGEEQTRTIQIGDKIFCTGSTEYKEGE